MRKLTVSRRRFGQGLGACLALALPGQGRAEQRVWEVIVSDFVFAPETLEITAGDTVLWINEDFAPHTATSSDGSWDTGHLEKGQSASLVFDKPGSFEYFCAFHPHMTGSISVQPERDA